MVVIAARGDERRLVAHPRLLLEAEDVAPEPERTIEIRHLQVHMADVDARVEHHVVSVPCGDGRTIAARARHRETR